MTPAVCVVAVCVAILACLGFAATAPRLGRRLPPRAAVRLLAPASLGMAGSSVFVLAVLAATWVGQIPVVATLGRWSAPSLRAADPVPGPVAVTSVVLLAAVTGWATVMIVRRVRALLAAYRGASGVGSASPVVVLDSAQVEAFTTPAPAGRMVVTSGLLEALAPDERRVVLAHERSHLDHRHIWWTLAADLAAAINPLLHPTAGTIRHAVERWADEDAADIVGDRRLVARTIARVALLKRDGARAGDALAPAATGGDVPQRVRALLAPPQPRRPLAQTGMATLLVAGTLATAVVQHSGDELFDRAAAPGTRHSIVQLGQ